MHTASSWSESTLLDVNLVWLLDLCCQRRPICCKQNLMYKAAFHGASGAIMGASINLTLFCFFWCGSMLHIMYISCPLSRQGIMLSTPLVTLSTTVMDVIEPDNLCHMQI